MVYIVRCRSPQLFRRFLVHRSHNVHLVVLLVRIGLEHGEDLLLAMISMIDVFRHTFGWILQKSIRKALEHRPTANRVTDRRQHCETYIYDVTMPWIYNGGVSVQNRFETFHVQVQILEHRGALSQDAIGTK